MERRAAHSAGPSVGEISQLFQDGAGGAPPRSAEARDEIRGRILKIHFAGDTFSAGKIRTVDGDTVGFNAKGRLAEGDGVRFQGRWEVHPKYGRQFAAATFSLDASALDTDGLAAYLAKRPEFDGIGPVRARRIAESFGANFEDALETRTAEMATAADVDIAVIEALRDAWREDRVVNKVAAQLTAIGLSPTRARRIAVRHGESVVHTIRNNPWWLLGRYRGLGFHTVDDIARGLGTPKDHPERVMRGVLQAVEDEEGNGHTWSPRATIARAAEKMLRLDNLDADVVVAHGIDAAIAAEELVQVSSPGIDGGALASPALHQAERLVDEFVAARGAAPGIRADMTAEMASEIEPRLNDAQAAAVVAAFRSRLSVMTGGAGVGKTFTISTIYEAAGRFGLVVALCAPTGKAARRIDESVEGASALTIHRLLEPDMAARDEDDDDGEMRFSFKRGPNNPIEADLVIVDEVSMVDVKLARSLFAAIGPKTSVVLVGDPNQLPPVGPGSLLRDLINTGRCPVTRLTDVVRQAGVLKQCISAVLSGGVERTTPPEMTDNTLRPWIVVSRMADDEKAAAFVVDLFATQLAKYRIHDAAYRGLRPIDPMRDVQILTPKHDGALGTIALNRALQRVAQAWRGVYLPAEVADAGAKGRRSHAKPMEGDRVIWTRNDYKLDVMNGTMGTVVSIDRRGGEMAVAFEGKQDPTLVPSNKTHRMMLAYAMTVHKSQGSEFPVVVTVCHKSHGFMHHRGLLYTAVSRARKSSILVGDDWGITNCAKRVHADTRRSIADAAWRFAMTS